jgi:hypothetical protein
VKFVEGRPFADPEAAAHKLVELATAFEPIQYGNLLTIRCLNIMVNR